MGLAHSIPSHHRGWCVFTRAAPDAFRAGVTTWIGSPPGRFEREVVTIDGQAMLRHRAESLYPHDSFSPRRRAFCLRTSAAAPEGVAGNGAGRPNSQPCP